MKTSPRYTSRKVEPKEYRVYGPPGCGKTTDLLRRTRNALERFGPGEVSVCSLTKAAASEVRNRGVDLPPNSVSTLHARCKRELGAGAPAETHAKEFARLHPQWAGPEFIPDRYIRRKKDEDGDETLAEALVAGNGVTSLERVNIHRQRMTPMHLWAAEDREFFLRWHEWMTSEGLLDYTGYLEEALRRDALPFQQVVFVDEAQDHTPLQLAVLRHWSTSYLILTGDDDQNLYEWSGADPKAFFGVPLPEKREAVLSQSYRVPRRVHAVAHDFIRRVRNRVPKEYFPRDFEGSVRKVGLSLSDIETGGRLPNGLYQSVADDRTSMLLTACRYMTKPLTAALIENRVPFHNPYRPDDKEWNPLREWSSRIESFLYHKRTGKHWTGQHISEFVSLLVNEGVFIRGGRLTLEGICRGRADMSIHPAAFEDLFEPDALRHMLDGDLDWLMDHCPGKTLGNWRFQWALDLAKGAEPFVPKVVVGTIHSVKGGEAQDVFLFPDRSASGYAHAQTPEGSDAAHRLFYVGMTRPQENLFLMRGSDTKAMW